MFCIAFPSISNPFSPLTSEVEIEEVRDVVEEVSARKVESAENIRSTRLVTISIDLTTSIQVESSL